MIRHIVMIKFKPEATESDRREVIAGLRALPDKIGVIREYEVGEDVLRSPRSWDMVIVSAFDDLEALEEYARHDDHVEVAGRIAAIRDLISVVDYDY